MKTKLIQIANGAKPLCLLGGLWILNLGVVMAAQGEPVGPNPFVVAHQEPRPGWPPSQEGVAEMVKSLGYDGMGMLWLDEVPRVLKAFDGAELKLSQIYVNVDLSVGQIPEARLKEILPLLNGRRVQLVLGLPGLKPVDERAVKVVQGIADLVRSSGTQVLISNMDRYPPRVTVEEVISLVNQVDRPNVGVMFDLFDYLVISKDHDYKPLLKRAVPRLMAVAVEGVDEFPAPDGSYHLKPLGRGSFDMFAFLKTLHELGYTGPIVLETQGIGGDRRAVLAESIKVWREYSERLTGK